MIKAIESLNFEIVNYLVDNKLSDVNQTDKKGISPLYVATYKGRLEMVMILIKQKADPWLKGVNGSTVLHICAERNFFEIAQYIL